MSIQLTDSQRAVVEDQGGSLLVSAAAGSGKTKVLVERLFRRVLGKEQADMDDFLIITYTRASAAELRERIARELGQRMQERPGDRHLQRQLLLVYQADIKTIDSFCTALTRENVHLLDFSGEQGLTADFRVLDENEASLLRRRVLPRVLEEFYGDLSPGALQLADSFGFGRDDSRLEELVLDLYGKLQSHAYPDRWLAEQRESWSSMPEDAGETAYGRQLLADLGRKARHWAAMLEEGLSLMAEDSALHKAYSGGFWEAAEQLTRLAAATEQGWDAAAAQTVGWPRLTAARKCGSPELKDRVKSIWDRAKTEMNGACAILDMSSAEAAEDLRRSAPAMEALLALCGAFSAAYQQEKLRRNVTDFSDQEHFAVHLLLGEDGSPTELARIVAGRYREVMVDEYQDTNQVQNCIFDAISRGGQNLFTVGDVKQSIYRFRLADPTIFLDKYHAYPDVEHAREGGPRKILLSQNFRSRQPVLDAVNYVFSAIMSQEMGEIDYGEAERLNFGASYLPERDGCEAEFHLLGVPINRGGEKPALSRPLAEARFAAERIRRLLDEGYPVTDEATGGLRPCRPEDIVILMRSPGPRLRHYTRALTERGIPCGAQEDEDFFATMEVAVVYSLLQILDNPRQDVPLIAVLRSPLMGFTADRLAMIRGKHPAGGFYDAVEASGDADCQAFLGLMGELRSLAKDLSVQRLMWLLYNRLNILGVFGAMPNGERRRENLIALYEHAKAFEGAGYKGLFGFVSHLRFLLETGEQPAVAAGCASGGVQIMSIHKSKGLEFPIVVLADLNKSFNRMDLQIPVLVHPKLGLGPMYIDLDRRIRYPTIAREAASARLSREMRAEEMRVLYVGMTRAKEKLIMTASMPSAPKKLGDLTVQSTLTDLSRPVPPETVDGARSMAEWILLPLLRRQDAAALRAQTGLELTGWAETEDTPWQVAYHDGTLYGEAPALPAAEPACDEENAALPVDREALDYVYPHQAAIYTPTKLTATQLKGREKDQEIAENTLQPYTRSSFAAPRFLSGQRPLTADQRGTAMHLVLQYLPLDGSGQKTVDELLARRLLTPEQAAAVDVAAIDRFLASPLAEELRQAKELEREFRFSLLVPAGMYYPELGEEDEVLLQGVVDLYAVSDGKVTVVDFKTDRVTERTLPERVARYRPQLEAYSGALEKILDKTVARRVLYFFHTGNTVEV
ncbi:MAG: helicase-exonuclease AddAB subunit AddA [Oscillospiraceae bacterium]|nr:helicase-exonuclease AddAB subunit AddA [Oscillospiraceae bacterium]